VQDGAVGLLDTTAPVIAFDNLTGVVRSSVLESLLTAAEWSDRYLGQSRNVITSSIDPPGANPHLRTGFKIDNLEAWMRTLRGDYLAALLTIARGWVVAGMPSETSRSDSYASWMGGIRGLLKWAEFPGTFGGTGTALLCPGGSTARPPRSGARSWSR
jgi:hypothetical protein